MAKMSRVMCASPMPTVSPVNNAGTINANQQFDDWQPFDNALYNNHVVLITSVRGEKCSVSWMEEDGTHTADVNTKELQRIPLDKDVVSKCRPTRVGLCGSAIFSFKCVNVEFDLNWITHTCTVTLPSGNIIIQNVDYLHQFQNLVREYSHGGIIFYNLKNGLDNVCLGVNDAN